MWEHTYRQNLHDFCRSLFTLANRDVDGEVWMRLNLRKPRPVEQDQDEVIQRMQAQNVRGDNARISPRVGR